MSKRRIATVASAKRKLFVAKYYAVKGEENKIFTDWETCKEFLSGKKGYKYKSFSTEEEAKAFLSGEDYAEKCVSDDLSKGYAVAFTDGSFEESLNEYSYGAIAFSPENETFTFCDRGARADFLSSRNIAGEVEGVLAAVRWAFLNGYPKLKIYHDYEGLSAWATGRWQAKGAVSCYYLEELKRYDGAVRITFEKVKGHSNNAYNEAVDKLAKEALFEGKRKVSDGVGFKSSGTGEFEPLCEYIETQNRGVLTSRSGGGVTFKLRDEKLSVYKRDGVISVVGKQDGLFFSAVGYFYRNITTSGVNRLIERVFNIDTGNKTFMSGVEVTEFLADKIETANYAPLIIFTLIDVEKRIFGTLKSKGYKGDKISRAFLKDGDGFKIVLPVTGSEKLVAEYAFFYEYRMAYNTLYFTKKELKKFCREAREAIF